MIRFLFDITEWQITWGRDLVYRSRDKIASLKQILNSSSILLPEASEILRQDGHIVFLKTEITNNGCNLQDSLTGQLMGAAFSAAGENARFVSLVYKENKEILIEISKYRMRAIITRWYFLKNFLV